MRLYKRVQLYCAVARTVRVRHHGGAVARPEAGPRKSMYGAEGASAGNVGSQALVIVGALGLQRWRSWHGWLDGFSNSQVRLVHARLALHAPTNIGSNAVFN